jgi:hypothetical protein
MPQPGDYTAEMVGAPAIRTWSKTLSTPGWYRVAWLPFGSNASLGCVLHLVIGGKRGSGGSSTSGSYVTCLAHSSGYGIKKTVDSANIPAHVTKVRLNYDTDDYLYVEIYYAATGSNLVTMAGESIPFAFNPIDFEPAADDIGDKIRAECNLYAWLDPPMQLGVEYHTTERWNGKPVYVKAISFGAAPNAAVGLAAHKIANLQNIAIESASMKNEDQVRSLPYHSETMNIEIGASQTNIVVQSDVDASGYSVYATVRYTKTTD